MCMKLCFAYKSPSEFTQIGITVLPYLSTTYLTGYVAIDTIADNAWHYTCVEIANSCIAYTKTTYKAAQLMIYSVRKKNIIFASLILVFVFILLCSFAIQSHFKVYLQPSVENSFIDAMTFRVFST